MDPNNLVGRITHPPIPLAHAIHQHAVDVGNPDSLNAPPAPTSDGADASTAALPSSAPTPTDATAAATADGSQQPLLINDQPPAKWICRATLRESPRAVKDVEFAPRHLGLRLAAAGADGVVRVYEAVDVMNLSHWPLQVGRSVG